MTELIRCSSLSVKYESHYAVKNVNFSVEKGDYLCIVGINGSGKTSVMKALAGLIRPSEGEVVFSDIKRTEIGYLPQQTIVQKDFPASVFEVVLSGRLGRGRMFYSKEDKKIATDNIERLGISDLYKKSYRDLSGGQQQRVLLARALCATEKVLMLDEPMTGLDSTMASDMYALLKKLNDEGLIIIMISHDLTNSIKYGNKILHLDTEQIYFGDTAGFVASDLGRQMCCECGGEIIA